MAPGKIDKVIGWRFQFSDKVEGTSWKAETRSLTVRKSNNPQKSGRKKDADEPMADNGVILRLLDVTDESVVSVNTANGNFEFAPREIPYGASVQKLDGAVEVERTGSSIPITSERTAYDFPAIAVDKDGVVYTAFVSFTPGLDRDERAKSLQEEPASLVETAIAAPIIYVALENILCRPKGCR